MEVVSIGKIVATHGVQGQLIIAHQLGENKRQASVKSILLEDGSGSRVPWFIESITLRVPQNEWIVKLEGIATKEKAAQLLKKQVYLLQADFDTCVNKQAAQSLIGYMLIENGNAIGTVLHIHEQKHQLIAVTEYKNKEALIPLHQQSILRIDRAKKEILVQLPEGLLELYL